jgi:hypothetical protein
MYRCEYYSIAMKVSILYILGKQPETESIKEPESIEQPPPLPPKSVPKNYY